MPTPLRLIAMCQNPTTAPLPLLTTVHDCATIHHDFTYQPHIKGTEFLSSTYISLLSCSWNCVHLARSRPTLKISIHRRFTFNMPPKKGVAGVKKGAATRQATLDAALASLAASEPEVEHWQEVHGTSLAPSVQNSWMLAHLRLWAHSWAAHTGQVGAFLGAIASPKIFSSFFVVKHAGQWQAHVLQHL